jgi:hypothetical protein
MYHASPFDDWVEEAPFRHLGVFALVIIASSLYLWERSDVRDVPIADPLQSRLDDHREDRR